MMEIFFKLHSAIQMPQHTRTLTPYPYEHTYPYEHLRRTEPTDPKIHEVTTGTTLSSGTSPNWKLNTIKS